jgi:azurin
MKNTFYMTGLAFALASLTSAATLEYDFSTSQLGDWTVITGQEAFRSGGLAANASNGEDGEHTTFLARSPAFRLDASGDLKVVIKGGRGGGIPASALHVIKQAQSRGNGPMGAGLRRVSDDAYLLSAQKSGNGGDQTITFNKATIGKLIELARDEVYTIDFFDANHGGWGHAELVRAKIPGTLVAPLPAASKEFGEADRTIYMGTKHGQLMFDKNELWVQPKSTIAFNFYNSDEMAHNFILCQPGKTVAKDLGDYVLANLEAVMKAQFIMKDPRILVQTPLVESGKSETIFFTAPEKNGDYPYVCTFPGHHLVMLGVMHVVDKLPDPKKPKGLAAPRISDAFALTVGDKPMLVRGPLKGSGPASICIGTPSGIHYAFDTERCILAKAWKGEAFINTKRAWDGRGGSELGQSGDVFVAKEAFPLRIKGHATPALRFSGYTMMEDGYPLFRYTVDGVAVSQKILPTPDGTALESTIHVQAPGNVSHQLDPEQTLQGSRSVKGATGTDFEFTVHTQTN